MAYQDDVATNKAAHQVEHAAATTDAQHRTADINHWKRMLVAANKWSVHNGSAQALINLGQNPQPLGDYF
jgi:hypothetical protein